MHNSLSYVHFDGTLFNHYYDFFVGILLYSKRSKRLQISPIKLIYINEYMCCNERQRFPLTPLILLYSIEMAKLTLNADRIGTYTNSKPATESTPMRASNRRVGGAGHVCTGIGATRGGSSIRVGSCTFHPSARSLGSEQQCQIIASPGSTNYCLVKARVFTHTSQRIDPDLENLDKSYTASMHIIFRLEITLLHIHNATPIEGAPVPTTRANPLILVAE